MDSIVTYFSSHKSEYVQPVPLKQVLQDFRSGKYARGISHVRSILESQGDKEYKQAKRALSVIAFCGEFSKGHAKENLVQHNNLLVFDIDHLTTEEMRETYSKLTKDEHILAFWVSPSGNGYKGLVRIIYQHVPEGLSLDPCYKKAFADVTLYFDEQFGIGLDTNCSDFSRICYVCWDEHLFVNEGAVPFVVDCTRLTEEEKKRPLKKGPENKKAKAIVFKPVNVAGKNSQHDRDVVSSIIKYLSKRDLSITRDYNDWLKVGFAIASTFNYDLGLKYFLALSRLDKGLYDEEACIEKLQECYMNGRGDVKLGTIVELARCKGFKGSSEDL